MVGAKTVNLGRDAALAVLAAMNAKYANLVNPLLTQERVDAMLRKLVEDVLASEGLESFLTMTTPEGGTPTVITVLRFSRFRSRMGQTSLYDKNVYGFLGEVEEGQLPPLMKLQDNLSMRQALAVREVVAGAEEELNVWYGEGPGNPRVPIQGDELVTESEGGLATHVKVPPPSIHPDGVDTVFHGCKVARSGASDLAATYGRSHDRSAARAHCAPGDLDARGVYAFGAHRRESLPQQAPHDMGDPSSRAGLEHGSLGNSQVGAVFNVTSGGTAAGGAKPLPMMGGGGGFGGHPYKKRKTKVFSPLEHERIRLACGLDPANYDAGQPPIYAVFLAEGRSMVKVEAVLQNFLAPAPNDWDPISVYASQELVRDMKDLKFGWGNRNTHDTCHRRISPFTVLQVSTDQQTKHSETQERADRATYLSTTMPGL